MLNIVTGESGGAVDHRTHKVKGKLLKDMVYDSLIIAGITTFSIWSGELGIKELMTVLKATGLAFFVQLAYEKGIKKFK